MSKESIKERFKKKHAYKAFDEMHFFDDFDDFGKSFLEVKRLISYKPHSHTGGRKAKWRANRKILRKFKTSMFSIYPEKSLSFCDNDDLLYVYPFGTICPVQWYGKTVSGKEFYARFRSDMLTVELDEELVFSKEICNKYENDLPTEDMLVYTGFRLANKKLASR